jgi:hypothetical protein
MTAMLCCFILTFGSKYGFGSSPYRPFSGSSQRVYKVLNLQKITARWSFRGTIPDQEWIAAQ